MPLDMAQCAREKLQASARDFWSSIRSFDDASKRREGDSSQATENAATMSLERIESIFKLMFGSCTTGAVPQASPETDPNLHNHNNVQRRSRSSNFVSGEHVYAQLFMDDQARATRAVDGLRERAASSPRSQPNGRFIPTTPNEQALKVSPPPTSRDLDISNDLSFDDGISAISAHTLEEMARIHDHKSNFYSKSNFSTSQVETISYPRRNPAPSTTTKVIASPLNLTRGRSTGTIGTKGTKSTKSSQDSEFASVWKKEEAKYWDDVVQQDKKSFAMNGDTKKSSKKGRRRSRCGSHSTKHDFTITTGTTASSSSYSNFSSHFDKHSHPNDSGVIQFDTRDILGSQDIFHRDQPIACLDPSRIKKCMAVPYGSELGEI